VTQDQRQQGRSAFEREASGGGVTQVGALGQRRVTRRRLGREDLQMAGSWYLASGTSRACHFDFETAASIGTECD
jgi:hypothetical protein